MEEINQTPDVQEPDPVTRSENNGLIKLVLISTAASILANLILKPRRVTIVLPDSASS